jgi:outer membrane lipoprotein-sorting protein
MRSQDGARGQWANACIAAMLAVLCATLTVPLPTPAQPRDDARDIMQRFIAQTSATDEVVEMVMRLIDSDGQVRQRTATLSTRKKTAEDDMRLIRFHTPPDMAKSGVLTIEHSDRDADQWFYLPAYHTSRRIASANRSDTYMGTDFSYEDITDPKIEQFHYTSVGKDRLQDVEWSIIEATPIDNTLTQESGYSKTVYWIDPEKGVAIKIEYYDRSGQLYKRLMNAGLEQIGRYHRWKTAEMHNLKRNHRTILEFSNRRVDQGLDDRYFTVRYLERGG